jgi:xylitol oxidase
LAALAEITVGGAISTGTHGSGPTLPNLANQVRSIQLVLANGTVANYTRASPEFRAVVVGLGAFGVITQVELELVPSYNISTYTFVKFVFIH